MASSTTQETTLYKALILTKDITENKIVVKQADGLTLQHFSYQCGRKRTASGVPYGPTVPSYLDFTIRVSAKGQGKVYFERAGLNMPFRYTFLFNATFDSKKKNILSDYDDAMIVTGYIVEMEEFFDPPKGESSDEQSLLRCRLLLCSISYLGTTGTKPVQLTITED